jgi:phosphoenolpyruvate carboxykinase (ATP)
MLLAKTLEAREILHGLSREDLRGLARPHEWTTEWGNAVYATMVRSRSSTFTKSNVDQGFDDEDFRTMREVRDYLRSARVLCVEREMGVRPRLSYRCRLYVTTAKPNVALMWHSSLFDPSGPAREPDFVTIYVPEWKQRKILIQADEGVTYVLGSDYYGEAKKSFLRMAMYHTKQHRGGLGLHAGSKILRVSGVDGRLRERGAIFFGLSGTGKTSLTCHPHDLSGDEGIEILQDDVTLMMPSGECLGTEDGFYIKTEGLDPNDQPILYRAATSPHATYENVWVEPNRRVDFANTQLTKNGRGVVLRREVLHTSDRIDLPKAHLIFFITRMSTIVPPVARLSVAQAAAAFMLGESVKTSAADPNAKGEPVRVVGTNPFIVGPKATEGNRFYDIIRQHPDMECYVLNTGRVGGEAGRKITLQDSQRLIREIARGTVEWRRDPNWGYEVATAAPGIDLGALDPSRYYEPSELARLTAELRSERKRWLGQFEGLYPQITGAFAG